MLSKPAIAVLGGRNSGKTSLIELLIGALRSRGLRISYVKHISKSGFTMDIEGKDTWRARRAGAELIAYMSDEGDSGIIMPNFKDMLKIIDFLGSSSDVIMLEGFSSFAYSRIDIAKIICMKEGSGAPRKLKEGDLLALCSFSFRSSGVLKMPDDIDELVGKIEKYVNEYRDKVRRYLSLPGIDCGLCGHGACEDLVLSGGDESECPVISGDVMVLINGKALPLNSFVRKIVGRIMLAILSSLKNVDVKGKGRFEFVISKDGKRSRL